MYFFDLADYYSEPGFNNTKQTWYDYGVSFNQVGCGGGPGFFMDDSFTTASATRDAWLKTFNQWFIAIDATPTAITEGFITGPDLDCGCEPDFKSKYIDVQYKYVEYQKTRIELIQTYKLCRYYYDYGKALNWQNIPSTTQPFQNELVNPAQAWGGSYEDFKNYLVNIHDAGHGCSTGSTTVNLEISNPYTNYSQSAITVTINFGTSFEVADLTEKVNNYDNAIKDMMCEIKNLFILTYGEMPDGLDENGNVNYEDYKDYYIF
jgi:hypothetical protein